MCHFVFCSICLNVLPVYLFVTCIPNRHTMKSLNTVVLHLPIRWTWEVVVATMNQVNVDCKDEKRSKQQTDEGHQRTNYEEEANRHALSLKVRAQLQSNVTIKSKTMSLVKVNLTVELIQRLFAGELIQHLSSQASSSIASSQARSSSASS